MDRVDRTPDEFIASIDDDALREGTERLDELITNALKSRCRVLWEGVFWGGTDQSIIGYGDIVQPRPRGDDVEWFLVGLARQKAHWSVYVNAAEDGRYLGQHFAERLGTALGTPKVGSASIAIRSLDHLDGEAFTALLRRADELTPPDRT